MSTPSDGAQPHRFRLLLDANVIIAVEPYAGDIEAGMSAAARLLRLATEQGHVLCVARATRDDLLETRDPKKRNQRLAELEKFHLLEAVPVPASLEATFGAPKLGTNDERDMRLLAALEAGAATHLVTDDNRLQRRAAKCGLGDRVLPLDDAVELLAAFAPGEATPPPQVRRVKTYTLNTDDSIFEGLRADYSDFDCWLKKVRREHEQRTSYVIQGESFNYAALALLKPENPCEYDLTQPVVKISTFKVAAGYSGLKYGELLLKSVLLDVTESKVASLYVEVLPTHPDVVGFLEDFGFEELGIQTSKGEHVLVKTLVPDPTLELSDLDYHIRYGPPALRMAQDVYVLPIEPRWHDQLFPEQVGRIDSTQLSLFPDAEPATHPWGNALRKAYICNSRTKSLAPGDVLLFYRSRDRQSISAVGIVEEALRSRAGEEIVQFVGRRTVYTPTEIDTIARGVGGALAIRFRQDRFIDPPMTLDELTANRVLKSWPQSITRISAEGVSWIRDRLKGG